MLVKDSHCSRAVRNNPAAETYIDSNVIISHKGKTGKCYPVINSSAEGRFVGSQVVSPQMALVINQAGQY